MFEESMSIETPTLETIKWHSYFKKTNTCFILKYLTFDFFFLKKGFRRHLSNNKINQNGARLLTQNILKHDLYFNSKSNFHYCQRIFVMTAIFQYCEIL